MMIWDGAPEEIEEWIDKVYGNKKDPDTIELEILESDIE